MKRFILSGLLAATLLISITPDASAQRGVSYKGDNLWMVTYAVGFPMANTKDYIAKTSWLGFTIEGRQFMNSSMTLGFSAGWQTFSEKAFRSTVTGSTTVTGTQFRYENIFPALATAYKYFGSRDGTKFYAGGGVGTYWIEQKTEVGLFAATENNWHFGLAPEIGVIMPRGTTSWVLLLRYNYAFAAGDIDDQSWLAVQLGLQYN